MKKLMSIATLSLICTLSALAADPVIHVQVTEPESGQNMDLRLPLTMLESLKPTIEQALTDLDIEGQEIDIRAIWQEIKDAGPNTYLDLSGEHNVNVSTTETHLVVKVTGDDQVDVSLPLAVCDALLGPGGVDFELIMETLASMQGEELISVNGSNGEKVRITIE